MSVGKNGGQDRQSQDSKNKKRKREKRKKKQRERKEEFRKPTVEEEIEIARVIEEKEKDLIEISMVEEMVLRWFHKYLKVFEKKESERVPTRKTWDHIIDLRKSFVLKKEKIYLLSRIEREKVQEFVKD